MNTLATHRAWRLPDLPWWRGVFMVGVLVYIALTLAQVGWVRHANLGPLTLAMLLGMLVGNTGSKAAAQEMAAGVNFAKGPLLRTAIVLYGFRVTFQDIGDVGLPGAVTAVLMVALTFTLAVQLGTKYFGMDRETAVLIGAGSSICGAAAVMATQPVLKCEEHKVVVAVATVVVFGTLAMMVYPLLYPLLGLSQKAYGIWAGSTIHEVAQVVTAGQAVGPAAESIAVIEKMLRVMLLAPFLFILATTLRSGAQAIDRSARPSGQGRLQGVTVPWFALAFIAVSGFNSLHLLPADLVSALVQLDGVLLAMAMVALGLRTQFTVVRQAGMKPLQLALVLFVFLSVGGFGINAAVRWAFSAGA